MSTLCLTEEQKKKIEENKRKAQSKRAEKLVSVNNHNGTKDCRSTVVPKNENTAKIAPIISKSDFYNNKHRDKSQPNFNGECGSSKQLMPSVTTNSSLANATTSTTSKYQHLSRKSNQIMKGNCIIVTDERFEVSIKYCAPFVDFCKQMETKSYDPKTKNWSFHLKEYHKFINGAKAFQPDIQIEGLPKTVFYAFHPSTKGDHVLQEEVDLSNVDQKLVTSLMPFQKVGVMFGIRQDGRFLLADDMGLGKTLQAICIACYYRSEWPLLIVCPSSVRYDWARQICHWLPSVDRQLVNVIDSGKTDPTTGDVNIMSYDLLSKHADVLKKKRFQVIIMDESHFLKNPKAVRTKAAQPLLRHTKRAILLSGTPALSRPMELFSQVSAVCPDMFKFHDFGLRYCAAKQQPWGWDYSGSSNMMELQLLLEKKIMIRRLKKEVLLELPSKTRQMVVLSPKSVLIHKSLKQAYKIMDASKLKGMEKRGALLQYFHETCTAKMPAVRGYIKDAVESDSKILIFAHHREMLDCIEDFMNSETSNMEYIRIDGNTPSEQRSYLCKKFQSSENHKLAILSITAANAGLNLSAANQVIFAELFWNPGILVQAEDRAHRIGQKDSVSVQYLVASHTADDFLWPLIQTKLSVLSKAGLTKDDFSETDTMRLADREQRHISDMFKSNFIDDSITDSSTDSSSRANDPATTSSSHSNQKRRHTEKPRDCGSNSFVSEERALMCQQSKIDNFFISSSPPAKMRKTTEYGSDPALSFDEDITCSLASNSNSIDNKFELSSEDVSTLAEINWDEEF